ncbi:MAG TPA: hypothetical protein VEY07_03560 [Thermoplasmata archaeon]|nr:hypothetical protein [Thermoplasmata archaeon]
MAVVKREKPKGASYAETAEGFDGILQTFRHAGGQEIEMSSLNDLTLVANARGLPILKHDPRDGAGWVHYLVLDGAGRLAYRFIERARP